MEIHNQQDLIISNLRMATYMANKYRWTEAEFDDLVQLARMGLVIAARRYRPEEGVAFSSYACRAMQRSIIRGVFGNQPEKRQSAPTVLSMEMETGEGICLKEIIPDEEDMEEDACTRAFLEKAIAGLTETQAQVIRLFFYEGMTMESIAKDMGITTTAVWNAKQRALKRMNPNIQPKKRGRKRKE